MNIRLLFYSPRPLGIGEAKLRLLQGNGYPEYDAANVEIVDISAEVGVWKRHGSDAIDDYRTEWRFEGRLVRP